MAPSRNHGARRPAPSRNGGAETFFLEVWWRAATLR